MFTTCDQEHPRLLFGKCPCCGCWVFDGVLASENAPEPVTLPPELERAKQHVLKSLDATHVKSLPIGQLKDGLRAEVHWWLAKLFPAISVSERELIAQAIIRTVVQ